eukprot:23172-Eustigmatos_ZCMA.PRE.1
MSTLSTQKWISFPATAPLVLPYAIPAAHLGALSGQNGLNSLHHLCSPHRGFNDPYIVAKSCSQPYQ